MKAHDAAFAHACTSAEGWAGETVEVFETFLANDPEGSFVAEYDGIPAGICVAVRYRKNGFVGELVATREFRGRGVGGALFRAAIEYLTKSGIETIYLDGDLEAVPLYERTGFRRVCRSLRYVGAVRESSSEGVRALRRSDLPQVCSLDAVLFGDDRGRYLERRFDLFPELCFVSESEGLLTGYVMGRPGVGVLSAGPWISRGPEREAVALLAALGAQSGGTPLRLGVLESSARAVEIIRSCGEFEEQTPSWRMVWGRDTRLGEHEDVLAIGSAAKG